MSTAATDQQADALVHFLGHHQGPDLIVIPVTWLPRHGRSWFLFNGLDALALSFDEWQSGRADDLFAGVGLRTRLPLTGEPLPVRVRCPSCGLRRRR